MDPQRRIIKNGALAIDADRIVDVGNGEELVSKYNAERIIDGKRKIVMPGIIDGHSHAGHCLVKTMGVHQGLWSKGFLHPCEKIYAEGSTEDFWYVEGLLSALERLRFGTTCSVNFFGGGDSVNRTDDPVYADRHCEAIEKVGIREFLAIGPRRPPFPRKYSRWEGTVRRDYMVSFEEQLKNCEIIIRRWHKKGLIRTAITFPTAHPERKPISESQLKELKYQSDATRTLSKKYNLLFTQDGYTQGNVKFAHEQLQILGPDTLISHATNLTAEDIKICKLTDTKIVHNVSSGESVIGRCPVPELIDAGVTVVLGSDAAAPRGSYDMFRKMYHAMHYHQTYFHDTNILPPGKVLEMVTVDSARALGIEKEFGSLEPGKKADAILIDAYRPHLYPLNMPIDRIVSYANGNDVDTVIVDGRVLMENRVVLTVDEAKVLDMAEIETEAMLDRTDYRSLLDPPERYWRYSRL